MKRSHWRLAPTRHCEWHALSSHCPRDTSGREPADSGEVRRDFVRDGVAARRLQVFNLSRLVSLRADSCRPVQELKPSLRPVTPPAPSTSGSQDGGAPGPIAWHAFTMTNALLERIVVDPAICFGKPTIGGHRLWVSLILGYLAEGWTVDAVVEEFPGIEADDVLACIAYGAQLADVRFADLDAAG